MAGEGVRGLDPEEKGAGQKVGGKSDDIVEENPQGMIRIRVALIPFGGVAPKPARQGRELGATEMFTIWTSRQYYERICGPVLVSFGREIYKYSDLFEKDYGQGLARTLLYIVPWKRNAACSLPMT